MAEIKNSVHRSDAKIGAFLVEKRGTNFVIRP